MNPLETLQSRINDIADKAHGIVYYNPEEQAVIISYPSQNSQQNLLTELTNVVNHTKGMAVEKASNNRTVQYSFTFNRTLNHWAFILAVLEWLATVDLGVEFRYVKHYALTELADLEELKQRINSFYAQPATVAAPDMPDEITVFVDAEGDA